MIQDRLDYVFKFEYAYKLGDCITFCDYDEECDKLKVEWNKNHYIQIQVKLKIGVNIKIYKNLNFSFTTLDAGQALEWQDMECR